MIQSTSKIITNPKARLVFFICRNNKSVRVNGRVNFLDIEDIKELGVNNDVFNPDETTKMIQGLLITVDEEYRH